MSYGILTGPEIQKRHNEGLITIEPFRPEQLNPASYDVTLGSDVAVYAEHTYIQEVPKVTIEDGLDFLPNTYSITDSKKPGKVKHFKIGNKGWVLKPGIAYLMHTEEVLGSDNYELCLDGKSTIGRLFVQVHATAGYGDPGFKGQLTLEVTTSFPVRVYAGMRIGQVRFHTLVGDIKLYNGHYRKDSATGAVAADTSGLFA